eukprot:275660-Amphidinium_carterae.1
MGPLVEMPYTCLRGCAQLKAVEGSKRSSTLGQIEVLSKCAARPCSPHSPNQLSARLLLAFVSSF